MKLESSMMLFSSPRLVYVTDFDRFLYVHLISTINKGGVRCAPDCRLSHRLAYGHRTHLY